MTWSGLALAVLALMLPAPTVQQAPFCPDGYADDDVIIAVAVSENTVKGANGNILNLDNEINEIFTAVNTRNSQIQMKLGFFSSPPPEPLKYEEFNRGAKTSVQYFAETVTKGTYLFQGLTAINGFYANPASKPVRLAAIYSSQFVNSDIPTIIGHVVNLEKKNYFVTLHAIGPAVDDTRYTVLEERIRNNTELNGRAVLFKHNNPSFVNGLSNTILGNVLRCNDVVVPVTTPPVIPVTPVTDTSRCETCIREVSSGLISHSTRCDMFIQCERKPDGTPKMTEHYCAPGTLFDQSTQGCDHAKNVLAKISCTWCKNGNNGPFPYGDSCIGYYECTEDRTDLVARCCTPGQSDNRCVNQFTSNCVSSNRKTAHLGYCKHDYTCSSSQSWRDCCYNETAKVCLDAAVCSSCVSTRINSGCHLRAVSNDVCAYTNDHAPNATPKRCKQGTVFSSDVCGCGHGPTSNSCPDQVAECTPTININFEGDQNKEWGFNSNGKWIGFREPLKTNDIIRGNSGRDAAMDGGQYGKITGYTNRPFIKEAYMFRALVKEEGSLNEEMVVFSNRPCDNTGEPSILVTLNPSTGTVRYTIRTTLGVVGDLTLSDNSGLTNTWKEVSLRYDQVTGKMNAFLRVLDGNGNRRDQKGDEMTLQGGIAQTSCMLRFGGEGTQPGDGAFFQGKMDDIKIYQCESESTPAANTPTS